MKILILDCDGVLYPFSQMNFSDVFYSLKKIDKKLNLPQNYLETLQEIEKTKGTYAVFYQLWVMLNFNEAKIEILNAQIVEDTDYSNITPNLKLFKIIKKLQKKYSVIVLTDNTVLHLDKIFQKLWNKNLKASGIKHYAIEDAKDGDFFHVKQDDGLSFFCKKQNIRPENCLLIEDNQANVLAAQKIGMNSIFINEKTDICKLLEELSF
ncbi:MAG: HAD family hydrolase [Alphaproteobacteria bacterium]